MSYLDLGIFSQTLSLTAEAGLKDLNVLDDLNQIGTRDLGANSMG